MAGFTNSPRLYYLSVPKRTGILLAHMQEYATQRGCCEPAGTLGERCDQKKTGVNALSTPVLLVHVVVVDY